MKFELDLIPSATLLEILSDLYAITVGIENSRRASSIDITPIAEDLLPEKARASGERPHWELILIFPKTDENLSTIKVASLLPSTLDVKTAHC